MFEFLSRSQQELERRGMSSGKKRLKVKESGWVEELQSGKWTKTIIFGIFAVLLTLFMYFWRDQNALFSAKTVQMILVVNLIVVILVIQFQVNHANTFAQNNQIMLVLGAVLIHLFLLRIGLGMGEYFLKTAQMLAQTALAEAGGDQAAAPPATVASYVYLLPMYAFAPMLMSILLGRNHGTFAAIYVSLLGGLIVDRGMAFQLLFLSLVSGFVAVYLTHQVRRRSKVVRAGLFVGIATTVLAIAMWEIPLNLDQWPTVLLQCTTTLLAGVVTAMLVSGILPFLESLFRITTDVSWIEMADLNHPLLKRLTYEAPGTYHHSLVVARLSEAAADKIGANGTMCRVAAYFHDIGKLTKPQYFIENIENDENPHDELTPTMSALIITAHVKDGVDLALKHKLNNEIIDVIREHHGTSLVQYFYYRAMERRSEQEKLVKEGKANPDDLPVVQEKNFRYAGPKPRSRESAIISLADGIESASRSLPKPTPAKVEQLINEITKARMEDGQLDKCGLTLADLSSVQKSFHSTLCSMMHNRISYPKAGGDSDGDPSSSEDSDEDADDASPNLAVVDADGKPKKGSDGKSKSKVAKSSQRSGKRGKTTPGFA